MRGSQTSQASQTRRRHEVACESCGAVLLVEADHRTVTCPFCASHAVVERPHAETPEPSFVLGFSATREEAARKVRAWIDSRGVFTRSDFRRAALERTEGVYTPAWLYGALARSVYRASIGEDYQRVTLDGGGLSSETATEWVPFSGRWAGYIQDVLVTGSRAVPNEALEAIEPYPLGELRRYDASFIAGWTAEEPTVDRASAFALAHGEAEETVTRALRAFMPGDRHRDLAHETRFLEESLDLVLLPVWTFAARYHPDKPPVRILVNGVTGAVHGEVPRSWFKVALAVLGGVLFVAGAILTIVSLVLVGS